MWIKLVSTVIHVVLVETEDQFVWRVNEKLGFSVKSMYRDLLLSNSLPERKVHLVREIWIFTIPNVRRLTCQGASLRLRMGNK